MKLRSQLRSLLLGGLLPVVAFTIIEDRYGTLWGLVVGMIFGMGEIVYEWARFRKVDRLTWAGNGMILVLGGVSLLTNEGVWFKLQPAILDGVMAALLVGSYLLGSPLMVGLLRKQLAAGQGPDGVHEIAPWMVQILGGVTLRFGLFFALHTALATWAALRWSTASWLLLKGVGFTASLFLYGLVEAVLLRRRVARMRR